MLNNISTLNAGGSYFQFLYMSSYAIQDKNMNYSNKITQPSRPVYIIIMMIIIIILIIIIIIIKTFINEIAYYMYIYLP